MTTCYLVLAAITAVLGYLALLYRASGIYGGEASDGYLIRAAIFAVMVGLLWPLLAAAVLCARLVYSKAERESTWAA